MSSTIAPSLLVFQIVGGCCPSLFHPRLPWGDIGRPKILILLCLFSFCSHSFLYSSLLPILSSFLDLNPKHPAQARGEQKLRNQKEGEHRRGRGRKKESGIIAFLMGALGRQGVHLGGLGGLGGSSFPTGGMYVVPCVLFPCPLS